MLKFELLKTVVTKYYFVEFVTSSGKKVSKNIDNRSLEKFVIEVEKMLSNNDDGFSSFYIDDENYFDIYYNDKDGSLTVEEYNMPVYSDFDYSLTGSVDFSAEELSTLMQDIKELLSE